MGGRGEGRTGGTDYIMFLRCHPASLPTHYCCTNFFSCEPDIARNERSSTGLSALPPPELIDTPAGAAAALKAGLAAGEEAGAPDEGENGSAENCAGGAA
jgi:hypothetical protein